MRFSPNATFVITLPQTIVHKLKTSPQLTNMKFETEFSKVWTWK